MSKMLNMSANIFLLILTYSLVSLVLAKQKSYARLKTDALSKTRCDLLCYDTDKSSKSLCKTQCRAQEVKPGTCTKTDSPQWAKACVEACSSDSHCDGTQRCCYHGCGSTCSEPIDLQIVPGLPALPVITEPQEKKRSTIIKWSDGVGDLARAVPGRILYILQEQHHVGPKYEESRLGEWNLLLRTNKTKASLRNLLKPGRWYRFRVAAVSATGTRGYSSPTTPFTPRRGPRAPPPPRRLRVRSLRSNNGTVTVRLEWREPRSDLPILRYKVFWSRRVRGLGGELDSVLVNHQTVGKDQTYCDITDLQPNSMYFLQVQTISQFGLGKLRSDKAEIFYNTTNVNTKDKETAVQAEPLHKRKRHIKGLKLNKIIWFNNRIKARISWEATKAEEGPKRYMLKWKVEKCLNDTFKSKKELSATTEQRTFEIYELDYDCSYKVTVSRIASKLRNAPEGELMVTVPGCIYFQRRMNTTLNCS